jgi:hypothetical protein
MNADEIKSMVETAISDRTTVLIITNVISVLIALLGAYFISYLTTKAKNKAMRADIMKLTDIVEEVKIKYIKELEVFKGNQELISPKKKELYSKVENLKNLMIEAKNDPSFNKFEDFFDQTKNILKMIGSNAIFKNLGSELKLIENDYNSWVRNIEEAKKRNEVQFSFNFDITFITLDTIQEKLMI